MAFVVVVMRVLSGCERLFRCFLNCL
jgi:hypothetical protein